MVNYEHLPLYKSSYDLLIDLYGKIKNFPKEYKYSLGEQLKKYVLEVIKKDLYLFIINAKNI